MGLTGTSTRSQSGWHLLLLSACCLPGPMLHLIYTQDQLDSDSPVKRRRLPCFTQEEAGSFPGPHGGTPDPRSSVGLYHRVVWPCPKLTPADPVWEVGLGASGI